MIYTFPEKLRPNYCHKICTFSVFTFCTTMDLVLPYSAWRQALSCSKWIEGWAEVELVSSRTCLLPSTQMSAAYLFLRKMFYLLYIISKIWGKEICMVKTVWESKNICIMKIGIDIVRGQPFYADMQKWTKV